MEQFDISKYFRCYVFSKGRFSLSKTALIYEAPLEIIINNQSHILIMFTPQKIRELVFGFIFTEGLIKRAVEIEKCRIDVVRKQNGDEIIEARVKIPSRSLSTYQGDKDKRVSYSSCGVCGKDNYLGLENGLTRVKSVTRFSMENIMALPKRMIEYQPLYLKTGGAHAAMLFDRDGTALLQCEDMGRHNALDKVIGATLIQEIPRHDKILYSSGRASLEMILKAARAGIPVFAAKSRPTSKAIEAAKVYNITLIDLAKGTNRIYTHARRIEGFDQADQNSI